MEVCKSEQYSEDTEMLRAEMFKNVYSFFTAALVCCLEWFSSVPFCPKRFTAKDIIKFETFGLYGCRINFKIFEKLQLHIELLRSSTWLHTDSWSCLGADLRSCGPV